MGSGHDVVFTSCGNTRIWKSALADCRASPLPESVTVAVKGKVPTTVGVPEMVPVAGSSCNPGGKLPFDTAKISGGAPPVAINCVEGYLKPAIPSGSKAPCNVSGGAIWSEQANGALS